MLIHADFVVTDPVTAAEPDDGPATITGVAVPYNTPGNTSAGPVTFARGALRVDGDGGPVPLVLDHDLTRPIGVVTAWNDGDDALRFTATLDPIVTASEARAQMRSGSRSGVSVGVDVAEYDDAGDGLHVTSADVIELSSVARPAFSAARVAAARKSKPDPDDAAGAATEQEGKPVTDSNVTTAPAHETPVPSHVRPSNSTVAVIRSAEDFAGYLAASVRGTSPENARDLTRAIAGAEHAAITAALSDVTTVQTPPQGTYLSDLDNMVKYGMPFVDAFTIKPNSRWPVKQRNVETWPTAGKQTAEKTAIPSTVPAISWANVTDDTYAHGNDVSVQDIEDNGEQILSDIFEITSEAVANAINADAIAAADASATAGGTGFGDLSAIGAALGQVMGRGGGRPVIVCAPDVWGSLWTLTSGGGPSLSRLAGMDYAPTVVPDAQIAAGTAYVGSVNAFKTYLSPVSRLRAVEVSLLGVNIGLYRRAAFRVVDAHRLVKVTAV